MLPNTYKSNETGTNNNRSRELWESGMAFIVDTLSVAAGNTAKDKRAKEASNRSQARGPIIRKFWQVIHYIICMGCKCNKIYLFKI